MLLCPACRQERDGHVFWHCFVSCWSHCFYFWKDGRWVCSVLEMSIRWLLCTVGQPNLITVSANYLTAMHVMISRVMAQNPALLTLGTTQVDTIARVLSVPFSKGSFTLLRRGNRRTEDLYSIACLDASLAFPRIRFSFDYRIYRKNCFHYKSAIKCRFMGYCTKCCWYSSCTTK